MSAAYGRRQAARRGAQPSARFAVAIAALALAGWAMHLRRLVVPQFAEMAADNGLTGAFHLHTARSHDSRVPLHAYLAAAARLGLGFIVVTDHNDAQQPARRAGNVWVLSAPELSTYSGHVIDMGGAARADPHARGQTTVLDDIAGRGDVAIVAHPTDAKCPWTGDSARAGAIEVANWAASARRRMQPLGLGAVAAAWAWPFHRTLALAQAYDRDDAALALWDAEAHQYQPGIAAIDAHGWLPVVDNLRAWHLVLAPPPAVAGAAAVPQQVVDALRAGRFYSVAGVFGRPTSFTFEGRCDGAPIAGAGDAVGQAQVDAIAVEVSPLARGAHQIVLLRDGAILAHSRQPRLVWQHPTAGTYRVEIWLALPTLWGTLRWVPALYSNKLQLLTV